MDAAMAQNGWLRLADGTTAKGDDLASRQRLACYGYGALLTFEEVWKKTPTNHAAFTLDGSVALLGNIVPSIAQLLLSLAELNHRVQSALAARTSLPSAGANGGVAPPAGTTPQAPERTSARDYALAVTNTLERMIGDALGVGVKLTIVSADTQGQLADALKVAELGEQIVFSTDPAEVVVLAASTLEDLRARLVAVGATPPPAINRVMSAAPLIAQLATAKSATEVNDVLQAAAVPVGTYEKKYDAPFLAVNAFAGAAAGYEVVGSGVGGGSPVISPFAPVGLHGTVPFGKNSMHVGAMLSLLNLGSLVSARLEADRSTQATGSTTTVKTEPTVNFANLFSPGLYFTLGIARSPFLVGGGAQVLPAARHVTTTDKANSSTTDTVPVAQFMGFVSADVPIFGF
jgi:hypothetical protein